MPARDLALGHEVMGRAANATHILAIEPFGELGRDVARAVIRQEPRPVQDCGLIKPGSLQCQAEARVAVTSSAFIVVHSFQAMM
jgi:hypothetical protein